MSVRQMARVFEVALPPIEKLLLLALADHADDDGGRIYPSVHRLAQKTGLCDRHVRRMLGALRHRGILVVVTAARAARATEYRMTLDPCSTSTPDRQSPLTDEQVTPDSRAPLPLLHEPETPAPRAAKPSGNRQKIHPGTTTTLTGFPAFWQAYPLKTHKGEAEKAWRQMHPPLEAVLAALAWQRDIPQWRKDSGQFIPHPATYLRDRCWEDERPAGASPSGILPHRRARRPAILDATREVPTGNTVARARELFDDVLSKIPGGRSRGP